MRFSLRASYCAFCFLLIVGSVAPARAQNTRFEFWPEVDIWRELEPNLNLLFIESLTRSRETQYLDAQTGANIDYRWFPQEIYPLALTFRAGYSYAAQLSESPEPYKEHRAIADFTPRYNLEDNLILFDRNRVEFRWVNSDYSTRYRNRLRLEYRPTIREKLINTYFQAEMVFDYSAHRWTRSYIQTGVEVPLAWFLSIEVNFTRQNSINSSAPDHVNALGFVVSFFF
jgi:hypothetical protein